MKWSSRRQRGATMVEFALVAPMFFILAFGVIDFGRYIQENSTVAEAARAGARQAAANEDSSDQPFAARDANPCSGTVFTNTATGHGCLTDAGIVEAVTRTLRAGAIQLDPAMPATGYSVPLATCTSSFPAVNTAKICIWPNASDAAKFYPGSGTPCANARAGLPLGRDPQPGDLGGRQAEWTTVFYRDCFLVQVTVVYSYKPATGLIQGLVTNNIHMVSSTSTITEY